MVLKLLALTVLANHYEATKQTSRVDETLKIALSSCSNEVVKLLELFQIEETDTSTSSDKEETQPLLTEFYCYLVHMTSKLDCSKKTEILVNTL